MSLFSRAFNSKPVAPKPAEPVVLWVKAPGAREACKVHLHYDAFDGQHRCAEITVVNGPFSSSYRHYGPISDMLAALDRGYLPAKAECCGGGGPMYLASDLHRHQADQDEVAMNWLRVEPSI